MMHAYSIWPYFVCMGLLLAIAATPLFKAADVPPNPRGDRLSTLDGLRGFLALGVFFFHASAYHEYISKGRFEPTSSFYYCIGQVGVETFFMITGYLFWSRLVAERGRSDWLQLYIGRVFRIAPLYLVTIMTMMIIIFVRLGFHLNVPLSDFAKQCIKWFSLGILNAGDFNGYPDTWRLLAGVTWSLRFEWFFYFGLPLLGLATRSATMHLPIAAGALVVSLIYAAIYPPAPWPPVEILPALFLLGMTCGSLARNRVIGPLANPVASAICGMLICGVFFASESEGSSYRAKPAILLGGAFYLIASGCSFFGVLTSRPARRLGNLSYGIYLLQGLVLALVFSVSKASKLVLTGPLGYWCMVLFCAALLVVVATLAHVGVERTGIELGKRLGQAIRNGQGSEQHRKVAD